MSRNTVMGTFDDLSDEEKTRALLQFLQHHQQLEQENETKQFQEHWNKNIPNSPSDSVYGGSQKSTLSLSTFWTVLISTTTTLMSAYFVHNLNQEANRDLLIGPLKT